MSSSLLNNKYFNKLEVNRLQANKIKSNNILSNNKNSNRKSYLFSAILKNASFHIIDDRNAKLDFNVTQQNSVLRFTDRPFTQSSEITMQEFLSLFLSTSSNSFKEDPPNVVLSFNNKQQSFTMSITENIYNNTIFHLKLLNGEDHILEEVMNNEIMNLFVDNYTTSISPNDDNNIETIGNIKLPSTINYDIYNIVNNIYELKFKEVKINSYVTNLQINFSNNISFRYVDNISYFNNGLKNGYWNWNNGSSYYLFNPYKNDFYQGILITDKNQNSQIITLYHNILLSVNDSYTEYKILNINLDQNTITIISPKSSSTDSETTYKWSINEDNNIIFTTGNLKYFANFNDFLSIKFTNSLITEPEPEPEPNEIITSTEFPNRIPYGYGSLKGWYSSKQSDYLLDGPYEDQYNQMFKNLVNEGEEWELISIPTKDELPFVGTWWDWDLEIQNIKSFIKYLGNTYGKFETHFVAATEVVDELIWEFTPQDERFEITNEKLSNALNQKINSLNNQINIDTTFTFTQEEYDTFNVDNVYAFSYIKVGDYNFKPFSPANKRINDEVYSIIQQDKVNGGAPYLKAEQCGGICYKYNATTNRLRTYLVFNMGFWYKVISNEYGNSDSDKKNIARRAIYASLAHEYNHTFQFQIIDPLGYTTNGTPGWYGEEDGYGETAPNAISRWWVESFAAILPMLMGSNIHPQDYYASINNSINDIKTTENLTADEFARRMVYADDPMGYGYLTRFHWGFLAAAYMAKLTSWKYVLVDFYYDFQRVKFDNEFTRENQNNIVLVPDLDDVFLHNFGLTEIDFLQNLYNLVKNEKITILDLLPNGVIEPLDGINQFNPSN